MNRLVLAAALGFIVLALLACSPEETTELVSPSNAMDLIIEKNLAKREIIAEENGGSLPEDFDYKTTWDESVQEVMSQVQTENLTPRESYDLGALYQLIKKDDEANEIFSSLTDGDSAVAYDANARINEQLDPEKDLEKMERLLPEMQERFPITPEMSSGQMSLVNALARHYASQGDHEKAVSLVLEELSRLPDELEAAYNPPLLLTIHAKSFIEAGRKEQLFELSTTLAEKYQAVVDDTLTGEPENVVRNRQLWPEGLYSYHIIARKLRTQLTQMEMINETAPALEFTHIYNAPEDFSFDDLKGKVVMLDFFANWCGPCKRAFPTMGKIYDEYKDQGFVLISVTGLQGYYIDGDINENDISPERELTLTEQFIADHNMTWPVVFTEGGAREPLYGVDGIPTFVLIDREGIVRLTNMGFSPDEEEELHRHVSELLAEGS